MPKKCSTCIYNRRCPIQNAKDVINCRPKYYVNSMWKIITHPLSFEEIFKEARKNHE